MGCAAPTDPVRRHRLLRSAPVILPDILVALSQPMPAGRADEAARLGFLEWASALPAEACAPVAARAAMLRMHSFVASAPAVGAFRRLLWQATLPPPAARRRGGARARRAVH